jgi:hypothetical protein
MDMPPFCHNAALTDAYEIVALLLDSDLRPLQLVRRWVRAVHASQERLPLIDELVAVALAQGACQPKAFLGRELNQVETYCLGRRRWCLILQAHERAAMGWATTSMVARYQHMTDLIRADIAKRVSGLEARRAAAGRTGGGAGRRRGGRLASN